MLKSCPKGLEKLMPPESPRERLATSSLLTRGPVLCSAVCVCVGGCLLPAQLKDELEFCFDTREPLAHAEFSWKLDFWALDSYTIVQPSFKTCTSEMKTESIPQFLK